MRWLVPWSQQHRHQAGWWVWHRKATKIKSKNSVKFGAWEQAACLLSSPPRTPVSIKLWAQWWCWLIVKRAILCSVPTKMRKVFIQWLGTWLCGSLGHYNLMAWGSVLKLIFEMRTIEWLPHSILMNITEKIVGGFLWAFGGYCLLLCFSSMKISNWYCLVSSDKWNSYNKIVCWIEHLLCTWLAQV